MSEKRDYAEHYPIVEGYFHDDNFYKDETHNTPIVGKSNTKYLDKLTGKLYRWSWSKRRYVDFIYSSHLLPIGSVNKIPTKYRQINVDENDFILSGQVSNALTCEHDRVIYTGILIDNSIFRIRKLDLLSGRLSYVADIPKASIGNYYIGGMLVDDEYIYLTSAGNGSYQTIYRVKLNNLTIDSFVSNERFQCHGKMMWIDNHTIVFGHQYGFQFFDTEKHTWTMRRQSENYGSRDEMSVGERLIMSHYYSPNVPAPVIYRTDLDTFGKITLPSSAVSVSCYNEGKFYIVQTNYLHIYDEETETIERSFSIPWVNPKTINYTNGILFVTQKDSGLLYLYDIKNNMYRTLTLPWTIKNISYDNVTRPTALKGYYFLPNITLCIVNYSESSKYNLGYKFNQYAFVFNKQEEPKFEYDERFVTFNDSHATVHDGTIDMPMETIDEVNHIKKIHMKKSDYTKLKSMLFISNSSTVDDGDITS